MTRSLFACLALSGALAALIATACRSEAPADVPYATGGSAGAPEDASAPEDGSDGAQDASPRPATMLGARCKGDGDCGEGLFCSSPYWNDWTGGGPAHGYCTKDCSADGDPACTGFEPDSFCQGPADGFRLCVRRCTPGGQGSELDFDIMKCWARQDVACSPVATDAGAEAVWGCWPTCGDDSDCPGIPCDRETGLCSSDPDAGVPPGASCDTRPCPARCVIGDPDACGFPIGLCMSRAVAGLNFGDLGYCVKTCKSDDDCLDEQGGKYCDEEAIPGVGVCIGSGDGGAPDGG